MVFIIFLRGINVSGANIIKMAELKTVLLSSGLVDVETYIQSGNIVCSHSTYNQVQIATLVHHTIQKTWGYDIVVRVLTVDNLKNIIVSSPIKNLTEDDGNKYYVAFLSDPPSIDALPILEKVKSPTEQVFIVDQAVYSHHPDGYGKTKLTNNYIESKLKCSATTRNWRTCMTMLSMANKL
jgi:uncharacterized protein (DUF1697 family)